MRYRIPIAAVLAGLLVLNGCASQRPIPTERIQSGHIEEILPPSTRVRVGLRSGNEIRARVQSTSDSSLTLVLEHHQFIGHTDSVVVAFDDIETVTVLGENPLSRVARYAFTSAALLYIALAVVLAYFVAIGG